MTLTNYATPTLRFMPVTHRTYFKSAVYGRFIAVTAGWHNLPCINGMGCRSTSAVDHVTMPRLLARYEEKDIKGGGFDLGSYQSRRQPGNLSRLQPPHDLLRRQPPRWCLNPLCTAPVSALYPRGSTPHEHDILLTVQPVQTGGTAGGLGLCLGLKPDQKVTVGLQYTTSALLYRISALSISFN